MTSYAAVLYILMWVSAVLLISMSVEPQQRADVPINILKVVQIKP